MNVATLKDVEQQRYYDALFGMYGTPGWAVVMADMETLKAIYNSISSANNAEELFFRKGQLDIIEQILTHQARSEHAYKAALEEDNEGEIDEATGGVARVAGTDGDPRL